MKTLLQINLILIFLLLPACKSKQKPESSKTNGLEFAKEMVEFIPYGKNPIFSGTNSKTWDKLIRERGFILVEDGIYKMWYTGYADNDNDPKYLGYATSEDWDQLDPVRKKPDLQSEMDRRYVRDQA